MYELQRDAIMAENKRKLHELFGPLEVVGPGLREEKRASDADSLRLGVVCFVRRYALLSHCCLSGANHLFAGKNVLALTLGC